MNRLIFIKLGGNLIAPKKWPRNTADLKIIRRLGREIFQFWKKRKVNIVLVNGSGNFGHKAVLKYGIQKGFGLKDEKARLGACKTQEVASEINKIVVREFLKIGLPVVSVSPHDIFLTRGGKLSLKSMSVISTMLGLGLTPVLYGDVIWDLKKGCTIFSGETSIRHLIPMVIKKGWNVKKIIQVGTEEGVYDGKGRVLNVINQKNFKSYKNDILSNSNVDVTGGMLHKVEESLKIASKYKIKTKIIKGEKGNLENELFGKLKSGTLISRD